MDMNPKSAEPPNLNSYRCLLKSCNFMHIICGLLAIALSLSQFTPIALQNFIHMDFRMINSVHFVTGSVGMYVVNSKRGSIASKSFYFVSLAISVVTAAFYIDVLLTVLSKHNESVQSADSESEGGDVNVSIGRVVIVALMLAVAAIELINSWMCISLLERMATNYPMNITKHEQRVASKRSRGRLTFVAVLKLFFAIISLSLGIGWEYYKRLDGVYEYVVIGMQVLAGSFALLSGMSDLYALYARTQVLLNLKVAVVLSVVSAVFCVRSIDFVIIPHFLSDYNSFRAWQTQDLSPNGNGVEEFRQFMKFALQFGLVVCLSILVWQSISSALQAGMCVERTQLNPALFKTTRNSRNIHRLFSWTCILCAFILIVQGVLSIIWEDSFVWMSGFSSGASTLWLAVLFLGTILSAADLQKVHTSACMVMAICCLCAAFDHSAFTALKLAKVLIEPTYANPKNSTDLHTGRVILYSVQSGTCALAALISLITAIRCTRILQKAKPALSAVDNRLRCYGLLHLVYFLVVTAVHVVLLYVEFIDMGADQSLYPKDLFYFMSHTNGRLALPITVTQMFAASNSNLLVPSAILLIIISTLSVFILNPAARAVYYLYFLYTADLENFGVSNATDRRNIQQQIMVGMALIGAVLVAAFCELLVCAASLLRVSYHMHKEVSMSILQAQQAHVGNGVKHSSQISDNRQLTVVPRPRAITNQITDNRSMVSQSQYAQQAAYNSDTYGNRSQQGHYYYSTMPDQRPTTPRADNYTQTYVRHVFGAQGHDNGHAQQNYMQRQAHDNRIRTIAYN